MLPGLLWLLWVILRVLGSVPEAQRATEARMCKAREGRRKERKTLTRCQTGPLNLRTWSTRIAEPALWCLLTRLGENLEVFTAIINQERAWFFPGFGASSHLPLGNTNDGPSKAHERQQALLPWRPVCALLQFDTRASPSHLLGVKRNSDARQGEC